MLIGRGEGGGESLKDRFKQYLGGIAPSFVRRILWSNVTSLRPAFRRSRSLEPIRHLMKKPSVIITAITR